VRGSSGVYDITLTRETETLIALFRGVSHRIRGAVLEGVDLNEGAREGPAPQGVELHVHPVTLPAMLDDAALRAPTVRFSSSATRAGLAADWFRDRGQTLGASRPRCARSAHPKRGR